MRYSRLWLSLSVAAAVLFGFFLAFRWPGMPLLAYWLLVAMGFGLGISLLPSEGGVGQRLSRLVAVFAFLIPASLLTTQLAARRVISSTHLVYEGVHLVGVDSFTVGAGAAADVRLGAPAAGQLPWLMHVRRDGDGQGWELEARSGIEMLRVRHGASRGIDRDFSVAQSAVLRAGDAVVVHGPDGAPVDTLRIARRGVELASGSTLPFEAVEHESRARQRSRLRTGTALAGLHGTRAGASVVHERFLRVQQLSAGTAVNGAAPPRIAAFLPGQRRYLVSAAPPYRLEGAAVTGPTVTVKDSALVEVRTGDTRWRFVLHAGWRREPGAERGVAIRFAANPKPLDTPLPAGVSCQPGAACGAISLRRLPPPIAHVALDQAGFDPDVWGLLGVLRVAVNGYAVVLPRQLHHVERGAPRPTALPLTPLDPDAPQSRSGSRWVLLRATGDRDNLAGVLFIGLGLALLLGSLHNAVGRAVAAGSAQLTPAQERAVAAGLAALLGLVLTRVAVGARVAFFDPFLERGIHTAVGLCVAIGVVVIGLLNWPAWVPPLMVRARSLLSGQIPLHYAATGALDGIRTRGRAALDVRRGVLPLLALSLVPLVWTTGWAPVQGMLTGVLVLLVWICVAWTAAFTAPWFDTFERGAQSVVEQVPPARASGDSRDSTIETTAAGDVGVRPTTASRTARVREFLAATPELSLGIAFGWLVIAHVAPRVGLLAGIAAMAYALAAARRRRRGGAQAVQPDLVAATLGVGTFGALLSVIRLQSENGSVGVFVLVVFVALASVRIGRAVGARLETRARGVRPPARRQALLDALLLVTPMFLLIPLAAIDMGLALVLVIPLGLATVLAVGTAAAGWRLAAPAAFMALLVLMAMQVVFPSMDRIRAADSHAAQAAAFGQLATVLGLRPPLLGTPMDRAAARSVATRDQRLAESLVVAAAPGPARDLLIPSIEQIWGARTYAGAGAWGEGLGRAAIGGRGVAETVAYAENTFAVFVMAEHGAVGGALVLLLYALLTGAVAVLVLDRTGTTPAYRASRALYLVAALMIAVPACYVALSNLAIVPITGQNMPFLGLNAWSDVAICAGVIGILITGTLRRLEEVRA